MTRHIAWVLATAVLGWAAPVLSQDANIALPVPEIEKMLAADAFTIVSAEISRPKAKGDITLKADVSFGGQPPIRVKLRKAEPGADSFNNVPRYDMAAYELQKLFLDPAEYVVPPTALRFVPLAEFRKYSPDVERTFPVAEQVLAVMQYWLQDIKVVADVYDPAVFDADPVYARHIGQLNILTDIIDHADSNVGNFLISQDEARCARLLDRPRRRLRLRGKRPGQAVDQAARESAARRHRRAPAQDHAGDAAGQSRRRSRNGS